MILTVRNAHLIRENKHHLFQDLHDKTSVTNQFKHIYHIIDDDNKNAKMQYQNTYISMIGMGESLRQTIREEFYNMPITKGR